MIQVQNLKKVFGPKIAVDGVSFAVKKGEVLGFLGPNGAGKSTTMRMITGFIPPSEGSVSIGGFDVAEDPIVAKRLFGYLPENAPSYTDMTVQGFLNFAAELRGFAGKAKEAAVERVAEMCFLEFRDEAVSGKFARAVARHGLLFKRSAYNFVSLAHDEALIDRSLAVLDEALTTLERAE